MKDKNKMVHDLVSLTIKGKVSEQDLMDFAKKYFPEMDIENTVKEVKLSEEINQLTEVFEGITISSFNLANRLETGSGKQQLHLNISMADFKSAKLLDIFITDVMNMLREHEIDSLVYSAAISGSHQIL